MHLVCNASAGLRLLIRTTAGDPLPSPPPLDSYSMMCSLREDGDEGAELGGVLPPQELGALLAATHRPLYCLQVQGQTVGWIQDLRMEWA